MTIATPIIEAFSIVAIAYAAWLFGCISGLRAYAELQGVPPHNLVSQLRQTRIVLRCILFFGLGVAGVYLS